MYDSRLLRVVVVVVCVSFLCTTARAAIFISTWPMKQRDAANTGRADFPVPDERMNSSFFDVFLWQTPSPGSPNEGSLSSTQMVFFDGAGPDGVGVVVGGYHWPKGVQGMDRHTGRVLWAGNPAGGETIGTAAPAFSPDGSTLYVVNDATESPEWPQGRPLMAFSTQAGPSSYWHNGADPNPWQLAAGSPTVAPDGRIFMHSWGGRPYAGSDSGLGIVTDWSASDEMNCGLSDPALYEDEDGLRVVIGDRNGAVSCYEGSGGSRMWATDVGLCIDASATIDPQTGNVYVGAFDGDVYVVGLDKYGDQLWALPAMLIYDHQPGVNGPQRAQSTGCLSHDGLTYYFQTSGEQGDGRLYAINTIDGSVKWSYDTGCTGWEYMCSSPIVTPNGIIIVGNNEGGTYYAIRDDGTASALIDTLQVADGGNARASASLSGDGLLYLPVRTVWTTPSAGEAPPTFQPANLFTAIDLNVGATPIIPPPPGQMAVALNNAVRVAWRPVVDPAGQLDHYAVYRSTSPFESVEGQTPIGTVSGLSGTSYLDTTAQNGASYYYAVTSVTTSGGEITDVGSIGPRTPYDETDLQVLSIGRTPRYPRYWADYTHYEVTEPSGFGPYWFSASTGLGDGQTSETQRWPMIGDPVTYTATIRNRGTNPWTGAVSAAWRIDGRSPIPQSIPGGLEPGDTATFEFSTIWDGANHTIGFSLDQPDGRPGNNQQETASLSVAFLTYADVTKVEEFRENTPSYPHHQTDDLFDWLNIHMARFNRMFQEAGCEKRVHYGILQPIDDTEPDPSIDTISFAIFPFRYRSGEGDPRLSGWYNHEEDIDYGLLHEMGHQLGMIDIYQFDLSPEMNQVSGQGYTAVDDLMRACSPFLSEFHALAMNHWQDVAHGYYGQYLYNLPSQIRLRLLDFEGQPLQGAVVKAYQLCERPGEGKIISDQVKFEGQTDQEGVFTLPNVPVDPAMVPPVLTGDTLHDNPFGYVAVVGTNGVLHFRVEYQGAVDYCWLDITEPVTAYFKGQTEVATFDRQLMLGGEVQHYPPDELTELNATDWVAWADGATASVEDDTSRTIVGSGSIKFVTDGGFDTYLRYPRTANAQWDLRAASTLLISFYAENIHGFQDASPWIRLKDPNGGYFQYQYYCDDHPCDVLNDAICQWRSYEIPLHWSEESPGWRRTVVGEPDMARINCIEIHSDTWDYGFTLWVDGVSFLFDSEPLISIPDAKEAFDGSRVDLADIAVSAAWPDAFYIESDDRAFGIRVEKPGHGLSVGDRAHMIGVVTTNEGGERTVSASWAGPVEGSGNILPLAMPIRSVGGGDWRFDFWAGSGQQGISGAAGLNNIGLLVRTCGEVTRVDGQTLTIDDGSGPLKCIVPDSVKLNPEWRYAAVTGVSSCEQGKSGLSRLLRVREQADIAVLQ